jgi:serine/threonine-protein phosphatase 4 catalytic subunit
MDCHRVIAALNNGEPVSESTLRDVCRRFTEVLAEEANVLAIDGAVNIIGDVHGQFYDLQKIFKLGGELPATRYLFLGDYVDRGYNSLETILLLACLKVLHPTRIFLLRGNHESRYWFDHAGRSQACTVSTRRPRRSMDLHQSGSSSTTPSTTSRWPLSSTV